MNPEAKRLWLEALRSGEYEQGRGHLQRKGTWCCMGVACDVARKNGVHLDVSPVIHECGLPDCERQGDEDWVTYDGEPGLPPDAVNEWAGVSLQHVALNTPLGAKTFVTLNDQIGYTFDQIADLIEEQL